MVKLQEEPLVKRAGRILRKLPLQMWGAVALTNRFQGAKRAVALAFQATVGNKTVSK